MRKTWPSTPFASVVGLRQAGGEAKHRQDEEASRLACAIGGLGSSVGRQWASPEADRHARSWPRVAPAGRGVDALLEEDKGMTLLLFTLDRCERR